MGVDRIIGQTVRMVTCEACSLAELCLPRGLHPGDLDRLEDIVRHHRPAHRGDYLFEAGDPLQCLYAVRSGSIKAHVLTPEGDEEILGFYLPGELLGFDALETGFHTCAATALETTSVCRLPFASLDDLCQKLPSLHRQLFSIIGREITKEQAMLLSLRRRTAGERLACFLLGMSARLESRGLVATEFDLSMSRQDIANYLGLTEETVCRLFTRFRKEGLMSVRRRCCRIQDMARLRELLGRPDPETPATRSA